MPLPVRDEEAHRIGTLSNSIYRKIRTSLSMPWRAGFIAAQGVTNIMCPQAAFLQLSAQVSRWQFAACQQAYCDAGAFFRVRMMPLMANKMPVA
jgi:hypothetical protein